MVQSFTLMFMVLIFGILLNGSWIYTSVCMTIVVVSALSYYAIAAAYIDLIETCLVVLTLFILIYAIYMQEYRDKIRFT